MPYLLAVSDKGVNSVLMRPVVRKGYETFTDEEPIFKDTLDDAIQEARLHATELGRDVLILGACYVVGSVNGELRGMAVYHKE